MTGFHNGFPLQCLAAATYIRSLEPGYGLDISEAKRLMRKSISQSPSSSKSAADTYSKFEQDKSLHSLHEAITLNRHSFQFMPTFAEERFSTVNNLSLQLFQRYGLTGHGSDFNEVIVLLEHALRLQDPAHPNSIIALERLSYCAMARYLQTDDLSDLDKALGWHRKAVTLCQPSHPNYSFLSANIVKLMRDHYEKTDDIVELEGSIQFGKDMLGVTQNPEDCLLLLREVVKSIQQKLDMDRQDLDEAITYLREARTISSTDTLAFVRAGTLLRP